MKLHAINHDLKTTLWCGPAALAAISGLPTSHVMAVLRSVTGQQVVKGVTNWALKKAGEQLGFRFISQPIEGPEPSTPFRCLPTLARWTAENPQLLAAGAVIVNVTGHYVTVKGRSFIDNGTRKPVSLKKAPHRRARVQAAWHVVPMPGFKVLTPTAPPPKVEPARPAPNPAKREAYRLAMTVEGLEIDREARGSDVIWVYPPPALSADEKDRYAGDHGCYDWDEVLKRVKNYIADLTTVAPCATIPA